MVRGKPLVDIWDATYWRGRERIHTALGHAKYSLAGLIFFTRIESHADMYERIVRDLEIKEALQMEIKSTPAHNNQS